MRRGLLFVGGNLPQATVIVPPLGIFLLYLSLYSSFPADFACSLAEVCWQKKGSCWNLMQLMMKGSSLVA